MVSFYFGVLMPYNIILGLCNEWEEDDIIAQVMAQSQQEYLDSLRTKATTSSPAKRSSGAKSTTQSASSTNNQDCDQHLNIPSDGSGSSCSNSNSAMDDS